MAAPPSAAALSAAELQVSFGSCRWSVIILHSVGLTDIVPPPLRLLTCHVAAHVRRVSGPCPPSFWRAPQASSRRLR